MRRQLPDNKPVKPYPCHASEQPATPYSGGSVKTVDIKQFPETTLSSLVMEIEPGTMRELHWHPDADEWQYYVEGEARMTVFDATSKARMFNYTTGDVGFVPRTLGHYIENVGETTLKLINVFNLPEYKDVLLNNWMALTPPDLIKDHLNIDDSVIEALKRERWSTVR